MSRVCKQLNRSRQSYYKALKAGSQQMKEKEMIMEFVRPIRELMPRIGGRKLHYMISNQLMENQVKVGRDKFFTWLKDRQLLIKPKRIYTRTTNSFHRFWTYENLADQICLTAPNQLWVSDITYLRSTEGFCYLALITDAYSRKIVGFDVSDSLELAGCLRALKSALQTASDCSKLIHHSDRGIQYCSNQYVDVLKEHGIAISMAEKGNCYENALAERINGILKDEFNLDYKFPDKASAIKTVQQSIYIYNNYRPHWSLNLKTPEYCHAA